MRPPANRHEITKFAPLAWLAQPLLGLGTRDSRLEDSGRNLLRLEGLGKGRNGPVLKVVQYL